MDKVIHPVSASDIVHVQAFSMSQKNIMLTQCGGRQGGWRIKAIFFRNEFSTCKFVVGKKKKKKGIQEAQRYHNRLEKGFLAKTLLLKTQVP